MGSCKGQQVIQAPVPGLEGSHLGCVLPQALCHSVQQLGCAIPGSRKPVILRISTNVITAVP